MPQDADTSTLVSLLWAFWIYWSISIWLEHLSSLTQNEERRRRDHPTDLQTKAQPAAFSGGSTDVSSTTSENLELLVSEILQRDGAASLQGFLTDAMAAYETIVAAFDAGDRDILRNLVSAQVYDVFSDASAERETRREQWETVFSQVEPPEIVDALIDDTHMEISIRFLSESFKLSRNAAGQLMDEAPTPYRNVDTWTFARMLSPRESTWRLVATDVGIASNPSQTPSNGVS